MKKVYQIGVILVSTLPTSSLLACATPIIATSSDLQAVQKNINEIKKLATTANAAGKQILPSTIHNEFELENNITEFPSATEGVEIHATILSSNDDEGSLIVDYVVTKVNAKQSVHITYTGFITIVKKADLDDIEKNIDEIKKMSKNANSFGKKVLPSTIKNGSDLNKNILAYPSPILNVTLNTIIKETDDSGGELIASYVLSKGEVEKTIDITYTGF